MVVRTAPEHDDARGSTRLLLDGTAEGIDDNNGDPQATPLLSPDSTSIHHP
jgi:hypothetical protein